MIFSNKTPSSFLWLKEWQHNFEQESSNRSRIQPPPPRVHHQAGANRQTRSSGPRSVGVEHSSGIHLCKTPAVNHFQSQKERTPADVKKSSADDLGRAAVSRTASVRLLSAVIWCLGHSHPKVWKYDSEHLANSVLFCSFFFFALCFVGFFLAFVPCRPDCTAPRFLAPGKLFYFEALSLSLSRQLDKNKDLKKKMIIK